MTDVALVPWQGTPQLLMTARDPAAGPLMVHRHPLEETFVPSCEAGLLSLGRPVFDHAMRLLVRDEGAPCLEPGVAVLVHASRA
jgi:hypothetical protein